MFSNLDLPCLTVVTKQADAPADPSKPKTKPREATVRAFGRYMRDLRIKKGAGGWSQADVAQLTPKDVRVSGTFISHIEQGKVRAPDPVLLRELTKIYGVDFDQVVELLRKNRSAPRATNQAQLQAVGEADMVVRGEEKRLIERYRQLKQHDRYSLLTFLDAMIERGAASRVEADFRTRERR